VRAVRINTCACCTANSISRINSPVRFQVLLRRQTGCRGPRLDAEAGERDTEHHSGTDEQGIPAVSDIPNNADQYRKYERGASPLTDAERQELDLDALSM
jgi:hypothetical protein